MNRNDNDHMTPRSGTGSDTASLQTYEVVITTQTRYVTLPYPIVVGSKVAGFIKGSKQDGVLASGVTVDFGAGNLTEGDNVTVVYMA